MNLSARLRLLDRACDRLERAGGDLLRRTRLRKKRRRAVGETIDAHRRAFPKTSMAGLDVVRETTADMKSHAKTDEQ